MGIHGNDTSRTLTDMSRRNTFEGSVGSHAQPIRPEDVDVSRAFDRQRTNGGRPPLDRDPRLLK